MKVFISYRRKDSQYIADRIYDSIERELKEENVFRDIDSIQFGRDFRRILQDAVGRCDALLVVIGPRWLGETDEAGRRRVDDPGDWVRIEIETALERDIPVIPLLVDGAPLPRGEDLPPSLQGLVYRHGMPVRPDPDFRHDMGRLIKALGQTPPPGRITLSRRQAVPHRRVPVGCKLLIIAIPINAILIALLLPAVQSARGGPTRPVHQQPEADRLGLPQLRERARPLPPCRHHRCQRQAAPELARRHPPVHRAHRAGDALPAIQAR